MHELGIVVQIVRIAQKTAEANNLSKVHKIILQVGELSGAIPEYVQKAFPAAIYNTPMEACELEVEVIPGIVKCRKCDCKHRLNETKGKCPSCSSDEYDVISGDQLFIKSIAAS